MKKGNIIYLLLVLWLLPACQSKKEEAKIQQWGVFELTLDGPSEGNPYMDVMLEAVFYMDQDSMVVPGFYDGAGIYRVRMSPDRTGEWTYKTYSNAASLENKKGSFVCVPADGDNHGPLKIVNTYYLQYSDGADYYGVGTTAYQWTSVAQHIQDSTLKTLKSAPFNKIRMCFFPKHYRYGNDTEPWSYPFMREAGRNYYTHPNYEYFSNFDLRVQELMDMGIQADVILFHPYDSWGYSGMGDEWNDRYIRYMIARLSAYRNVWWSLANEWDVPSIKESIDWEGIGMMIQQEDPHQRLRGIHNWYGSEDHFYDHTRPWITHVCTQTHEFHNAIKWRDQYQKPLLLDEMRYEGDVSSSWGNMSSEEMTSYFWMGGLSGGYGTHGDTYVNDADDSTEVRWWAKGGNLVGDSPSRIAFFRLIMEEAPVTEMTPAFKDNGNPWDRENNIHTFSKEGEYYLLYTAGSGQLLELNLPEDSKYSVEIIDTWNMHIEEMDEAISGDFSFTTELPYTALRIQKD